MKSNYLLKSTPFLTPLLLIILLTFSNQKEYAKLKILIWNTPSLKLGTYIAISTGTGFMLSYLTPKKLAKIYQATSKKSNRYQSVNKYEEFNENIDTSKTTSYENTLIERDIKDPSPTIKASFRIIGRKENIKANLVNNNINNNDYYDDSRQSDEQYNNQTKSQVNSISADWNDESYSSW